MPSCRFVVITFEHLVALALSDEVPHRVVGDQDLEGSHHAAAVLRHEPLGDDGTQGGRQLDPDLLLAPRGEDVDDAVDRLGGIVGVQGREDEVAGLGQGDGQLNGLEVAHLTDEQDVGVLPQGGAESPLEGGAVGADLPLGHGGQACACGRTRSGPRW